MPVVVWLAHGVHGNEISSADAALLEALQQLRCRGSQRNEDSPHFAIFRRDEQA
jgi:hypothetical protein